MITSLLAVVLALSEPADTTITLQGVTVSGQRQRDFQMRSSQSAVQVSHDYLQQHFSGSLMQTLEGKLSWLPIKVTKDQLILIR